VRFWKICAAAVALFFVVACGASESPSNPEDDTVSGDTSSEDGTDSGSQTGDSGTSDETTTSDTEDAGNGGDGTTDEEPDLDLAGLDLHGTIPPEELASPEFVVTNLDEGSRTEADLLGQPTVMWFFPAAGTPG